MILDMLLYGDIKGAIISFLLMLPIILFSLSFHEMAHALAASKLGDPTAKNLGRMTLNPLKHIDVSGFISMMLFGIGWAKPVPINARNFKNPRNGMALSALAGPLSNLFLGAVFAIVSALIQNTDTFRLLYTPEGTYIVGNAVLFYVGWFFHLASMLNLSLAVFNMIPAPPFDGSRILYVFLPPKYYFKVMQYERYIGIGILVLFFALSYIGIDVLGIIVDPIIYGIYRLLGARVF